MPHAKVSLVHPVALPAQSRIAQAYLSVNLADAFAVALPPGASADPEVLARFMFAHQAPWVGRLMALRDLLVSPLGLKTAQALGGPGEVAGAATGRQGTTADGGACDRVAIFKVYSRSAQELVLGEDDSHLDFRISVLCRPAPGAAKVGGMAGGAADDAARQLVVSTVVHCHNRLGRAYIALIAPFHRLVVQSALRRASRLGWPQQA